MAKIIEQRYFYGGVSEDNRLGAPNTIAWAEGMALNNNSKYIELSPKATNLKDINGQCKIILEVEDDIFFFGDEGQVHSENNSGLIYQFDDGGSNPEIVCAFVFNEKLYMGTMVSDSSDLKIHTISLDKVQDVTNWATNIQLNVLTITNIAPGTITLKAGKKSDVRFLISDDIYLALGYSLNRIDKNNVKTEFNFTTPRGKVAFITNIGDLYYRIYLQNGVILEWDGISSNISSIRDTEEIIRNGTQKGTADYFLGGYALSDSYFAGMSGYASTRLVRSTPNDLVPYKNEFYNPSNQNSIAINKDTFYMIVSGENGSRTIATWGKKIGGLQNAFFSELNTGGLDISYPNINAIYIRNNTLYVSFPNGSSGSIDKYTLNARPDTLDKGKKGFFIMHTQVADGLNKNKLVEIGLLVRDLSDNVPLKAYTSINGGNFFLTQTYKSGDDKYGRIKLPISQREEYIELTTKFELERGATTNISPKIYGYYLKYEELGQ